MKNKNKKTRKFNKLNSKKKNISKFRKDYKRKFSKSRRSERNFKNEITSNINIGDIVVGVYSNNYKLKLKGYNILGEVIPKFVSKYPKVLVVKSKEENLQYGNICVSKVVNVLKDKVLVEVTEILGDSFENGIDITAFVKYMDWPTQFSEKTLNQCNNANKPVIDADREDRVDFTSDLVVTVDGEDTRDFDDAINVKRQDDKYVLSVHIADVANYVQYGSATDKEAFKRGVSLYLPDRTYPMLPKSLSNGICSLNEGEERLTLSCIMTIDKTGEVIDYKICEGYINVSRRMTYNEVFYILADEKEKQENKNCKIKYNLKDYSKELVNMLKDYYELSKLLNKKRVNNGSVDFNLSEVEVILDKFSNPIEIKECERNFAHSIIEEFMLSANECVAKFFCEKYYPFVYRVHEKPTSEKCEDFIEFIKNTDYDFPRDIEDVTSFSYQNLLKQIEGKLDEKMISKMALRTMSQAVYSDEEVGHFALAKKYYSHFTSPIRRYPDLQIHRIIHDYLRNRINDDKVNFYKGILNKVSLVSSENERKAIDIERKVDRMKIAGYMKKFIGKEFEGMISSVVSWGFYVEIDNHAEGLVHIKNLKDDYYIFDEKTLIIYGEKSGKTYKLGDMVKIKLTDVYEDLGQLDFVLV